MKFIPLLILLLTPLFSDTSDFSLIIKKKFDASLFDVTEDYDRTITAVGFSKMYNEKTHNTNLYTNAFDYLDSISNKYGYKINILKINNNAKIITSKISSLAKFTKALSIVKTSLNGYFIGGYTLDGKIIVLKLDSNANILNYKIFGTKNYNKLNKLILLNDGGVLTIGSSITSRYQYDKPFESGLGNNDVYISRFTSDLKLLWSKKYGTNYDDIGIDAVEANDGTIIVLSSTSDNNNNRYVNIMRISENGDKFWLKILKNEYKTIPTKIIKLKDGNFLALMSQYNQINKEHIRLLKFDINKNTLIDREIFTSYPTTLKSIDEFSNGTFVAVGYVCDKFNTDGVAMIIDNNLVMLRQEHYGNENYDSFNGVKILYNSQIGVVGVHTDKNSQETKMWILKLNKDLSIAKLPTHSINK